MNADPSANAELISALSARLRGRVIGLGDPGYDEARRMWNGAIDRRPSAIATCADAEDVAWALRIALQHDSPVTVRGGGHNVAGRSVRDGALLIDLAGLRTVGVNAAARIATVQGGALWSDVDEATSRFGLATTGGLISTTGVGGFTLGGGTGWLMRRFGLACDNVVSASVVLADGRAVRASATESPELFWGLRGGAGGLGIVTSYDYRLHEVAGVVAGLVIHPAVDAEKVLRHFRDFAVDAPDEFCGVAVLTSAPPFPFLDVAWHGKSVVILALCWCGEVGQGEQALAPLAETARPLAASIGAMGYATWQKALDPAAPAGRYNYWQTLNYAVLDDGAIGQLAAAAQRLPTPQSEIHVQHMGGAVARVTPESTAFASRDAQFFVNLLGIAPTLDGFAEAREGVGALHARLMPTALASALPNFTDRDVMERGDTVHADRLRRARERYDPGGVLAPG